MRIKSLQVHGFKSFVDRTVFTFEDGITAVVGPNGCGKSNVVDAVRWAMGEQSARRLRGKTMEDVIFGGSESRPAIGMAEVVLTFDNSDGRAPADWAEYSEIQICRRLYRSGESEYLINKIPSRLKDIHDFFRDTGIGAKGYTIVEQGKVAEVVSARPEDRRILIEEAAGISKYKARRRESESKLRSTEQNLARINDLVGEIRRQINTLERQARKAASYKRQYETQRVLELSLALDERHDLLVERETSDASLVALRDSVAGLEAKLSEQELGIEEKRLELASADRAANEAAEQLYRLRGDIKAIEGRIELARRECEGIDESNAGRGEELGQLSEQLAQAQAEVEEVEHELTALEDSVVGQRESLLQAEQEAADVREHLRERERERDEQSAAQVEVLTAVARCEDRLAMLADARDRLDQRLRAADREFEVHQSETSEAVDECSHLEQGLRNLLAERDRFQEQLLTAMREHERTSASLHEADETLRELRELYEGRRARLSSLREVVDGCEDVGEATRHLMGREASDQTRIGVRGLVRELIEVDRRAELAVEVVLADRAEAVVVADSNGAIEALECLRRQQTGRGVLLVEQPIEPASLGIVPLGRPLLEHVRPKPGFEGVARALLRDVYLVQSLSEVFDVYGHSSLPASFVTPEGDVLTSDGVLRGGGESASRGLLSRPREIRELEAEVASLEARVSEQERAQQALEARLVALTQEVDNLRSRHHTAAIAVANHEKDLERTEERVKSLGEVREQRAAERSDLLAESEQLLAQQQEFESLIESRREEQAGRQSALDQLSLKISSTGRELSRLESRATELRVVHDARVESRDRLRERLARAAQTAQETRAWIERREREIEAASARRVELVDLRGRSERELAELLVEEEAFRLRSESLRDAYRQQGAALRGLEEALRAIRAELAQQRERAGTAELSLRELEMRLEHQAQSIRERWQIDLDQWQVPDPADFEITSGDAHGTAAGAVGGGVEQAASADVSASGAPAPDSGQIAAASAGALREARRNAQLAQLPREERERELASVRKALQALGDVNLGAIEEHENLAERFRYLSEQKGDLEQSIESLREAIARINRTSRRRFRETFEAVSKRFSENFPRLFGGGSAHLELGEAEDVLEAGIDIMAQPPGKRLQNVNLLSGGEKTMTALALLVAVFQVRPSPFFLVDEVDAALDDANVGRFNQLILEMAAHSQFLVITHNKRTIEVADVLYGVTMEQKGVSKLVAVELT